MVIAYTTAFAASWPCHELTRCLVLRELNQIHKGPPIKITASKQLVKKSSNLFTFSIGFLRYMLSCIKESLICVYVLVPVCRERLWVYRQSCWSRHRSRCSWGFQRSNHRTSNELLHLYYTCIWLYLKKVHDNTLIRNFIFISEIDPSATEFITFDFQYDMLDLYSNFDCYRLSQRLVVTFKPRGERHR